MKIINSYDSKEKYISRCCYENLQDNIGFWSIIFLGMGFITLIYTFFIGVTILRTNCIFFTLNKFFIFYLLLLVICCLSFYKAMFYKKIIKSITSDTFNEKTIKYIKNKDSKYFKLCVTCDKEQKEKCFEKCNKLNKEINSLSEISLITCSNKAYYTAHPEIVKKEYEILKDIITEESE